MYMLTFTSLAYFLQAGRSSISFRQDWYVSPAVMRRSMEMEQLSATAQRMSSRLVRPDGTQTEGTAYVDVPLPAGKRALYGVLRYLVRPIRHLL